jgi:hypothetical protein
MLLMKRRFANVLVNMNVNSSGNLDTYNLFALSMMMTTKRSFPTMSYTLRRTNSSIKTKTAMASGTSSISSVTKVLLELPIQNTRVLDTTFSLSGRMGRSHLNLSISLARTTQ